MKMLINSVMNKLISNMGLKTIKILLTGNQVVLQVVVLKLCMKLQHLI